VSAARQPAGWLSVEQPTAREQATLEAHEAPSARGRVFGRRGGAGVIETAPRGARAGTLMRRVELH